MALTLLIAGSYAAYVSRKNAEEAVCDESIDFAGKTKHPILKGSTAVEMMEVPLACINWFRGNHEQVVPRLKERVEEMLRKNPFLGGWLILDNDSETKALSLLFDPKGEDQQKDTFRVLLDLNLSMETTTYEQTTQLLQASGAMLPLQHETLGKDNQPLFRVSLIPDAQQPQNRFALVVSMAHAIGDTHTFYHLVRMLDCNAPVQSLILEDLPNLMPAARRKMGDEAFDYLATACRKPPLDLTATRDEPTVMKAFHAKEEWFPTQEPKARRASLFQEVSSPISPAKEEEGGKAEKGVSENSVLASWFFGLSKPDIAFLGLSLRDRFEESKASDLHAGSYVGGIPYTPLDYATPALIEESLETLHRCGIQTTPLYDHENRHLRDIREPTVLPAFRWTNTASLSLNWAHRFQDKLELLPDDGCEQLSHLILFDATILKAVPGRLSFCYMFTSVPGDKAVEPTPCSVADAAAQAVAEMEEELESGAGNGEEPAKWNLHGKRAGVLVVCRESVWKQIQQSGIIDEMIADA